MAALPISILLVTVVVGPLVGLGLDGGGPAATFITVALQSVVYLGLIRLLVVGPGALSWRDMGIGGRTFGVLVEDVAWGTVLAVPVLVVTLFVANALLSILPAPDSPIPPAGSGPGLIFNLLAAVVIAPLGEELFFRGYATTAWARAMTPSARDHPRRPVLRRGPRADGGWLGFRGRGRASGGRVRDPVAGRDHARARLHPASVVGGADRAPRGLQRSSLPGHVRRGLTRN